jgi:hypothetical protein
MEFRSFYPKVQHKYSQKHYHQILICKYLTQNMYLKKPWGEQGNLLYYSSAYVVTSIKQSPVSQGSPLFSRYEIPGFSPGFF